MALDKNWLAKTLAEHGIPIAPKDHWIYSEGPSIVFVNPSTRLKRQDPIDTSEGIPNDLATKADSTKE